MQTKVYVMRYFAPKLALMTCVTASLLLAAYLSRVDGPQSCISSTGAQNVFIQTSTGQTRVPGCNEILSDFYIPNFKELELEIDQQLTGVESLQRVAQKFMRTQPFNLIVNLSQPQSVSMNSSSLSVGRDVLSQPESLNRIVLMYWLKKQVHLSWALTPDALEILTNISLATLINQYERPKDINSPKNLLILTYIQEIAENSISAKQNHLEYWLRRARSILPADLRRTQFTTLEEMTFATKTWAEFLGLNSSELNWFEVRMQNPNLWIETNHSASDNTDQEHLKNQFGAKNLSVFQSRKGQVRIQPDSTYTNLGFKITSAKYVLVFSQESLSVGEIEKFSKITDRVIQVVQNEIGDLDIRSLADEGLKSWIEKNPTVGFRVFHLPSLSLAKKYGLPRQHQFDSKRIAKGLSRHLRNIMGLDGSVVLAENNVAHVPGPLSVVEWFR